MNDAKKNNINVDINPEVAAGTYSNLVFITHSHTEFVLDFAQSMPGHPNPVIRNRVVMAPLHCKQLLSALAENIAKYEKQFGTISAPTRTNDETVPYDILGKA